MKTTRIATVQFEHKSGDKDHNLEKIEKLTRQAADKGAEIVCFHETSITGYAFLRNLSENQFEELAESVPDGKSVKKLIEIAGRSKVALLAGLIEQDEGSYYNTCVCVTGDGLVARFRKLHPFINKLLSPGDEYVVFDLNGTRCGILICYDNNVIENVRATTLLGAEIIFMPHVTGCTYSAMPGRDYVDPKLWTNRHNDPQSLREEFDSMKNREWLLRWLPARAYDNGVYVVFANPIGMDDDQVKGGGSMILDPWGNTLAECRSLEDEVVVAECIAENIKIASAARYRQARRPELYKNIIGKEHTSVTRVEWMEDK
jgi:predicted amidohydrolase